MANLKVKLVKGLAGKKKDQIAIAASLGLEKSRRRYRSAG